MQRVRVRFVFRKYQGKDPALLDWGKIYVVINVNARESEPFSIEEAVFGKDWRGTKLLSSDEDLNERLESVRARIKSVGQTLEINGRLVDCESVKETYLLSVRKGFIKAPTLLEVFDAHTDRQRKSIGEGTLETYETRRKNLVDYLTTLKKSGKEFLAADFDLKHAALYYDFLEQKDFGSPHIVRQIRQVKGVLKEAAKRGIIEANPLINWEMTAKTEADLRHLEKIEVDELWNWLPKNKKFIDAKFQFLFMTYTGQHIGDYLTQKKTHFVMQNGSMWLLRRRNKDTGFVKQKLHPFALQIISKYGGRIEDLPKIDPKEFGLLLKTIDEILGFGLNLSSKIARKTYAHLCLNVWRLDLETTALMMGCKVDNVSQYARVDMERVEANVKW